MTVHFHFAYDLARIGTATITVQEQTPAATAVFTYTSGVHASVRSYSMQNLYAISGTGAPTCKFPGEPTDAAIPQAFIERVFTSLATASALAGTYTLSAWTLTGGYTISCTTAFRISSANALASRLLGGIETSTYATSHTSTFKPWYSLAGDAGYLSNIIDDYEMGEIAADGVTDDMLAGGEAWTKAPIGYDFTLSNEPKANVWRRATSGSSIKQTWTWQDAWEHARNVNSFMILVDPTYSIQSDMPRRDSSVHSSVHRLRADGAKFAPSRSSPDWDQRWDLRFLTRVLERNYDND